MKFDVESDNFGEPYESRIRRPLDSVFDGVFDSLINKELQRNFHEKFV